MKKLEKEYNKHCKGAWRVLEFGYLIELENIETGERMTYEPTGWTAKDSAYIADLCGYDEREAYAANKGRCSAPHNLKGE